MIMVSHVLGERQLTNRLTQLGQQLHFECPSFLSNANMRWKMCYDHDVFWSSPLSGVPY